MAYKTCSDMIIQLASLDTFWFPALQSALASHYQTRCVTTWSLKKKPPNPALPTINLWPLHYLLQAYKMTPCLQRGNRSYLGLCCIFDHCLSALLEKKANALCYLSGVGLGSARRFRRISDGVVIVESGSTYTDWQHRVVFDELAKNGITQPLFPEAYRKRVRTEFQEADFIQIPSKFSARTYLEAGIPENRLLVAPYGADTSRFRCRNTKDRTDRFCVICPSGVNLRKGARILAEAWRKLGWKDAELHWVGSPGRQTRHLFQPAIPGLVWHEHMDQERLASLYRSCDVMVLPSFEEGFARVLIEAAASGLALVATPNTGVEELFTAKGAEGWLVPAGQVDDLCGALEEARQDRDRTFAMGQRAAARARQEFSLENYGMRVRANFSKILGR